MATANAPVPALREIPIAEAHGTYLKLYVPEPDIESAMRSIGEKIRCLIPDLGTQKSGAQFALEATKHADKLTFDYLTSRDGKEWTVTHSDSVDVPHGADTDALIDERRDRLFRSINWDATRL